MADVTVNADAYSNGGPRDSQWGPYWTSDSVGYLAFQIAAGPIEVEKTADSGASWDIQDAANNPASANNRSMAVWWDRETPGLSTVIINIAWVQTTDDEVHYISFDTAADAYGTDRTIDALTISTTDLDSDVAITVAKNGRVFVAARGDFEADTENTDHSMRASTDLFASVNTSEASPYTADEEVIKLFPGADTDENDIAAVVYDVANQDLEFWKFDDSGNSWGVTAIDATMATTGAQARDHKGAFDATVRHSDAHIIVAYWNDVDTATADFRCVDITPATPTITQKTNIDDNTAESSLAAILINQQNNDIYVAYVGSDAGDETFLDTVVCYYKLSTDGGGTWGSEAAYGVQNDDLRMISAGRTVGNDGGRFMPAWFNDDLNDVVVNDGNDVEIPEFVYPPVLAVAVLPQPVYHPIGVRSY